MIWLLPILPLFLLAVLPLQTEQTIEQTPGISLQESRQVRFPSEEWRGTPVTPAWKMLLERSRKAGWRGKTNGPLSGVRRHGQQKYLYDLWIRGRGAPAFPPSGPSRHLLRNIRRWGQWSQAVDVSRPRELVRAARSLGVELYAPYDPEPWHIEARYAFSLPAGERIVTTKKALLPIWVPLLLLAAGGGVWIFCRRSGVCSRSML